MSKVIEIKRYVTLVWRAPSGGKVFYSQELNSWWWIDSSGNVFGIESHEAVARLRRIKEATP